MQRYQNKSNKGPDVSYEQLRHFLALKGGSAEMFSCLGNGDGMAVSSQLLYFACNPEKIAPNQQHKVLISQFARHNAPYEG